MSRKYHIAVDIGSGSGRLFVGWLEDGKMNLEELHRFETGDVCILGKHVRNVYRWHEEIVRGLKKFSEKYGDQLCSIGVDSMGEDIVVIDKRGEILYSPLSYRDVVAAPEVLKLEEEKMGNREIYMRCGNQSVQNDTLRQLITLSLREDEPLKEAAGMLFLGDFFQYMLCGHAATESALANYGKLYNQHTGTWDDEIFKTFGIPDALKMEIVFCGDKLGKVYPMICKDAGIKNEPDVISSSIHDSSCAAFSVPDMGDDWAFISSGSWSIVGVQTDEPIITENGWQLNFSNSYMPMRKNMLKRLVAGMWIMQRLQKEWKKYSFSELVELASTIEDNNCYFNPDDERLFNPESMCQGIADIVNEQYGTNVDPADAARISRIVFESLALKYRFILDKLRSLCGRSIDKFYVVGGGSYNQLLSQLTADACEIPVYTGIHEASVIGNLMTQMIGSGELEDSAAAKKVIAYTFPLSCYQPRNPELWKRKYEAFTPVLGKDYP